MAIQNIRLDGDSVLFSNDGRRYVYIATRGRLYIGGHDFPVHQAADGSFAFSDERSLGEVVSHANLLGANVRELPPSV